MIRLLASLTLGTLLGLLYGHSFTVQWGSALSYNRSNTCKRYNFLLHAVLRFILLCGGWQLVQLLAINPMPIVVSGLVGFWLTIKHGTSHGAKP